MFHHLLDSSFSCETRTDPDYQSLGVNSIPLLKRTLPMNMHSLISASQRVFLSFAESFDELIGGIEECVDGGEIVVDDGNRRLAFLQNGFTGPFLLLCQKMSRGNDSLTT